MAGCVCDPSECEERRALCFQDWILPQSEINGPDYLNRKDLNFYVDSIFDQQNVDLSLCRSICSVNR